MDHTATYSPEDNKLRLYPAYRLDKDTEYARVKAAGFIWAPKQELFVAPMWTPEREDLLIELCGEVGDEDKSLVDRAEERAGRFEDYSDSRRKDYDSAHRAVKAISDNIPFGQPILVGHHSERHARRDAEKIENGMRKAVKMWETSKYWTERARGALMHAKYKELPAVRARRIKKLEADLRRVQKSRKETEFYLTFWRGQLKRKSGDFFEINRENVLWFTNLYDDISRCYPHEKYPRNPPASQYEGMMSMWSALGGSDGPEHAIITAEQARDIAIRVHEGYLPRNQRWVQHYENRLLYERAMLEQSGGTEADRTKPEVGGACRCWASPRGGFSLIQKVNKVSVTVLDTWGNGGRDFTRTIPFDKLRGLLSKADVDQARSEGRIITETKLGFLLRDTAPPAVKPAATSDQPPEVEAMKESLKGGVKTVSAPQLFPTPPDLAKRVIELAEIDERSSILEPSAGTGALLKAVPQFAARVAIGTIRAVEINSQLVTVLQALEPGFKVDCRDFLECQPTIDDLCHWDRIIMNPPFENGSDIKHIQHARQFLRPGGVLVAICANGSRQQEKLKPEADQWIDLPEGSFACQGTNVRTAIVVYRAPARQPDAFAQLELLNL